MQGHIEVNLAYRAYRLVLDFKAKYMNTEEKDK